MTGTRISVVDCRALETAVDGTVIPTSEWVCLQEAERILDQANAELARARSDARQIREAARRQGYDDGCATARRELATEMAALVRRRHAMLGNVERQVSDLALAVVERVAPALGADAVVPALVARAIDAARGELVVRVRVHPDGRDAARAALDSHVPDGDVPVAVAGDDSLDAYTCVLETAAGTVRAGWDNQLEAIRAAFALAIDDDTHAD